MSLRLKPRARSLGDESVVEETAAYVLPTGNVVNGYRADRLRLAKEKSYHINVVYVKIHSATAASLGIPEPAFKAPKGKCAETRHVYVFDLSKGFILDEIFKIQILRLETQALSDHQLLPASICRVDHLKAVCLAESHRLFAEHVLAGF